MKNKGIYTGLNYSLQFLNLNWIFRVWINGKSCLRGVSGLIKIIGVEFLNKFATKALERGDQVSTFKLRRGIVIQFVSH